MLRFWQGSALIKAASNDKGKYLCCIIDGFSSCISFGECLRYLRKMNDVFPLLLLNNCFIRESLHGKLLTAEGGEWVPALYRYHPACRLMLLQVAQVG